LLDLPLLPLFLLFNLFVLVWCARQIVADAEWLRDPEQRVEVLREFGLDRVGQLLNPFRSGDRITWNPLNRLLGWFGLIGAVLWADCVTVRELWPWLIS
jgi:hypothetical protein